MQKILGIDTNSKTVKGQSFGFLTAICYLAPSDASGFNTCQDASPGCRADCLFSAGRGAMRSVIDARIKKTLAFFRQRAVWMAQLVNEISAFVKKAEKQGFVPCVRMNGTSDVPWELVKVNGKNVFEHFPSVQFYDYTKSFARMSKYLRGEMPQNYHLTFSRSETNHANALNVLAMGGNVAVVFDKVPASYLGFKVIVGDESDLRFLDEKGVVVGLKAKGRAKKSKSGFVVHA